MSHLKKGSRNGSTLSSKKSKEYKRARVFGHFLNWIVQNFGFTQSGLCSAYIRFQCIDWLAEQEWNLTLTFGWTLIWGTFLTFGIGWTLGREVRLTYDRRWRFSGPPSGCFFLDILCFEGFRSTSRFFLFLCFWSIISIPFLLLLCFGLLRWGFTYDLRWRSPIPPWGCLFVFIVCLLFLFY